MERQVGVPTASGVMSSLTTYGAGAAGGVVASVASNFLGNGILGGAVAAALAGSVVKGNKGDAIAAVAGYQVGQQLLGMLGGGNSGDSDMELI